MRIIGGEHKGRRLKTLGGDNTRPTLDKVREAVFNALYDVSDTRVLDLFGGSGAMALEALSRGANSAVIVDNNKAAINIIKENVKELGYEAKVDLRFSEFQRATLKNEKFDLIFADPPYGEGLLTEAINMVAKLNLLSAHGMIVAETGGGNPEFPITPNLNLLKKKQYGTTKILYYRFDEE
ncbi:MAG: 16S rRNA (guanine(966)-N(2))-methyltransferase RsmD [Clostridiales bacterium]